MKPAILAALATAGAAVVLTLVLSGGGAIATTANHDHGPTPILATRSAEAEVIRPLPLLQYASPEALIERPPPTTTTTTIPTTTTTQPVEEVLEAVVANPPPDPAPPVEAAPPDPGMGSGVEQWRSLVAAYFPGDQVERALCIMSHESGGNAYADNPSSTAAGLFQFLRSTWDTMVPIEVTGGSYDSGQVYNADANVRSAAWLQAAEGWSQWSPYNRGLCH